MSKKNRYPGVFRRGTGWAFRVQFNEGGERWGVSGSGYATAKDAWNARNEAVKNARRGPRTLDKDVTLAEFLRHWVEDHGRTVKPTTAWNYDVKLRGIIGHALAQKKLRLLTEKDYRTILTDQGNAYSTVRAKRTILRSALSSAVRAGILDDNPVDHVHLARVEERPETEAWDLATATRFLAQRKAARDPLYEVWHLALVTGLRRGELHGLRWSDIDFDRGLLYVRRQRTEVGGRVVEQYPKTSGSEAPVYLDEATVALLLDLMLRRSVARADEGYNMSGEYIVLDPRTGKPYNSLLTFRYDWKRACENADVPVIKFHGLRHTTASIMAETGIPLAAAQQRLRHWSQAMTRHYTHVASDQAARTADQLGRALSLEVPA